LLTYLIAAFRGLLAIERETVAEITKEFSSIVRRLEATATAAEAEVKKAEQKVQGLLHQQALHTAEAQVARQIASNVSTVFKV